MFDTEITVMSATVRAPSQEALDAGMEPHIELVVIEALLLPFLNPQTQEPAVVPAGQHRFSFGREDAISLFQRGLKAAQDLPEKPVSSGKIMVAHDMSQVAAAADNINKFR